MGRIMADPKWPLLDNERKNYLMWLLQNKVPTSNDYNMEQFYRSGIVGGDPRLESSVNPNDQQMHYPDAYKQPNHPTFSTDSNYYNRLSMPNTPQWQGGELPAGRGESWTLSRPNGEIVEQENPFKNALARLLRTRE